MISGRTILSDALKAALPSWQIVSDARAIDVVKRPGACVLWTEKRNKNFRGTDHFLDEISLFIATAVTDPTKIDDDLDDLLFTVADVLEPLDQFHWETAERSVLAEAFLGWKLTVQCAWPRTATPEPEPDPEPTF